MVDFVKLFAKRTVWKISPWKKGEDWDLFRDVGFIGLGNPSDNLTDLTHYPGPEALPPDMGAGQKQYFWAFAHEMKRGDVVIAVAAGTIFGVGTVAGGYVYSDIFVFPHFRQVQWFPLPQIPNRKDKIKRGEPRIESKW